MRRAARRTAAGLALAIGTLTTGLSAGFVTAPAHAASAPPVTQPDAATMFPGNIVAVFPIVNDTDADTDHDDLTVCRLGTEQYKKVQASFSDNGDPDGPELDVFSAPGAKPGAYTFTYYACDFDNLVPGTVTITVAAAPAITVTKVSGQPGKLKVHNPAAFPIRFLFGSFSEDNPDGTVVIPKGATVTISVHRAKIGWLAYDKSGNFLKIGRVSGIKLPQGDHAPASSDRGALSPRLAAAWAKAS
jgi:hypothetical protein